MAVQIKMSTFTADVNAGMTRKQLMEKYGISANTVKEVAKKLNLTIKKDYKPKFELIDDTQEVALTTPCVNHDLQQTTETLNA